LPVELTETGFFPFLVNYFIGFVAQAWIFLFLLHILQTASIDDQNVDVRMETLRGGRSGGRLLETASDSEGEEDVVSEEEDLTPTEPAAGAAVDGEDERDVDLDGLDDDMQRAASSEPEASLDLHTLGTRYLSPRQRVIFDVCVMVHFLSILMSYNLAGAQTIAQLLSSLAEVTISPSWFVLPIALTLGAATLTPGTRLESILSVATFIKGTLLVVLVGAAGIVATEAQVEFHDSWLHAARPVLITSVALGGAANILPVAFRSVDATRREQRRLQCASVAGLATVFLLNVIWCLFVLMTVPQHGEDGANTLEQAAIDGDISTIPLSRIIEEEHSQFAWIGILVDTFVLLSVTVSFTTMGRAMVHVLEGFAVQWERKTRHLGDQETAASTLSTGRLASCNAWWSQIWALLDARVRWNWRRVLLGVVAYTSVVIFALLNPDFFFIILGRVTSLALNCESGLFISIMLQRALLEPASKRVPAPLPWGAGVAAVFVTVYFGTAIIYDFLLSTSELIYSLI
jgi:amino acid permease